MLIYETKTCKIDLAYSVLPLFMKSTRQIELTFENDPMFGFRYGLRDGEFQASFRESLTLSLVAAAHSLFFLTSQYKKSIP